MKNILVKSLYKIKSRDWGVNIRREAELYEKYQQCHEYSFKSLNKNLVGPAEYYFFEGEFDTIHQALHKNFLDIYQLWKDHYPCNILYTDPDTLAINLVNPWNQYDKFMMFNYSDPRAFYKVNRYNLKFPSFFNAGVRYFPSTMKQATWDIGLEMINNWDFNSYDTEQIILNQMLWSQDLLLSDALIPEMNFQAPWMDLNEMWRQNLWNGWPIEQAKIIHFHGSRNIDAILATMAHLSK